MEIEKATRSVNSLSQSDKDRLKGAISELNDSMIRTAAERDLQKEIRDSVCEELGLDKKIVGRMAKVYYNSNFANEIEQDQAFQDFYSVVLK